MFYGVLTTLGEPTPDCIPTSHTEMAELIILYGQFIVFQL